MGHAPIRTIQKFRVGLVELSSNDFNPSSFYDCMKNYPSAGVALDGQSRKELESEGWYSDNMVASLQKNDFEMYGNIKNFSLVLLLFKNKEQKNFIRLINFLSKQVRTLSVEPEQFTCENVLAAAKMLVIDSIPPYADVYINNRKIGEAPVWTSLSNGNYEVQCKLPDDAFPPKTLTVPETINFLCKRENQTMQGIETGTDDNADIREKTGSWLIYGLVGALSIGGTLLPFLIF
jgi:hypothetical protein